MRGQERRLGRSGVTAFAARVLRGEHFGDAVETETELAQVLDSTPFPPDRRTPLTRADGEYRAG